LIKPYRPGRQAGGKVKKLEKAKMDQEVEEGSQKTDRGREDEMMGNESKYDRRDANICSIECRTGDESRGCSGLKKGRSHKSEGSIVSKSG
jgi:hypothetical protein